MGLFKSAGKMGIAKKVFDEAKKQWDKRQNGSTSGKASGRSRGKSGKSKSSGSGGRRRRT